MRLASATLLTVSLVACASGCNAVAFRDNLFRGQFRRAGLVEKTIVLPSGTVRYFDGGSGPPVVLLHGFAFGALENWRKQGPSFARTHRVIAPDLYWFGHSVPTRAITNARAQADGIHELLAALGTGRADVMGMSYGGLVALRLALAHPEDVGRLVLVDSAGVRPNDPERQAIARRFPGPHRPEDLLLPPSVDALHDFLNRVFVRPHWIPRWVLAQIWGEFQRNGPEKTILCRSIDADVLGAEELAAVHAQTLVLWGKYDPLLPSSMAPRLTAALPNARMDVFANAGHSPMLEDPKRFTRAVLDFLADAPTAP